MTTTEHPAEAAEAAQPQAGDLAGSAPIWVPTKNLVVGKNRKTDLAKVEGLVESIRQHGNKIAILAVALEDGRYDVRDGAHRTKAGKLAGRELMKVEVIEATDPRANRAAAEAERLELQYNTGMHVRAMSVADEVQLTTEMLDLGINEAEVAARFAVGVHRVRAARTVGASETVRELVAAEGVVDLLEAAAIDEFADNPDDVAALAEASLEDRFEREARAIRARRAREAEHAEQAAPFLARGLSILDGHPTVDVARSLRYLYRADGQRATPEDITDQNAAAFAVRLEREEIKTLAETGARVYTGEIDSRTEEDPTLEARLGRYHANQIETRVEWEPVYYCTDLAAAGLSATAPTPAQADADAEQEKADEAARLARARVIWCNEKAREATVDRREFITGLFAQWKRGPDPKKVREYVEPKGVRRFTALISARDRRLIGEYKATEFASEFLGDLDKTAARIAEERAWVVNAALVFGGIEGRNQPGKDPRYWRYDAADSQASHLAHGVEALRLLRKLGYKTHPIEDVMLGEKTAEQIHADALAAG